VISGVGHLLFTAVMLVAALDQGGDAGFGLLALAGVVGAAAAGLLATSTTRPELVTGATALMAVSFVAGAAAAIVGGSVAYLIAPVVLLLANAMVVGAARRVHSTPGAG
jgi:uncharacterized membrane protein YoaK (UPF0700 family)